jgi:hypothetical protein
VHSLRNNLSFSTSKQKVRTQEAVSLTKKGAVCPFRANEFENSFDSNEIRNRGEGGDILANIYNKELFFLILHQTEFWTLFLYYRSVS